MQNGKEPLLQGSEEDMRERTKTGNQGKAQKTDYELVSGSGAGNPGASIPSSIFNLVKNVAGAGVLSLPSGVAAGTGLLPAVATVIFLGIYSMATFSLIGRMCAQNKALTFLDLGEKCRGKGFAQLMALTCTLKTFLTCLAYSLVTADCFTSLTQGVLLKQGVAMTAPALRTPVLLGITVVVLLPLCLLKDLSMLAYTSLLGSAGLLYTLGFMALRFEDGSYAPGGRFYESQKPEFQQSFLGAPGSFHIDPINTPILVCLLSTAFIAHYNAPRFYEQLKDRSVPRFDAVVTASFAVSILFFMGFMLVGYLTFGKNSQGNILNNYSAEDPLASIARLAVGLSVVFTYPLAFTGLRDGLTSLLGEGFVLGRTQLSLVLLSCITALALVLTDVGFVNAFGGAIFGAAIIYCFPGLILIFTQQRQGGAGAAAYPFGMVTAFLGVCLAVAGGFLTVAKHFFPEILAAAPVHPLPSHAHATSSHVI